MLRYACCLSLLCVSSVPLTVRAATLDMETFTSLARQCGPTVAPSTLAALAKTESGFETLAILDNKTGESHVFRTLDEAAATVEQLIARGDSVDVGLMQINSANLKRFGMSARDALDPCKSIHAGAEILTKNYLSSQNAPTDQVALRDAISQYNTGNRTAGYRNGYVRKVENAANSLPASASEGGLVLPVPDSWNVWQLEDEDAPPPAKPVATKSSTVEIF